MNPHTDLILEKLRTAFSPIADQGCDILAIGSLGKGEVSAVETSAGKIRILNDLEFLVVRPAKGRSVVGLPEVSRSIKEEFDTDFLDIDVVDLDKFVGAPLSMATYDIKHGTKVVLGSDRLIALMPNYTGKIPKWCYRELLGNRMIGCILGNLSHWPEQTRINQTVKLLIACGDTILAGRDNYDHRYAKRLEMLRKMPKANTQLIIMAYNYKLAADFSLNPFWLAESTRTETLKHVTEAWHSLRNHWQLPLSHYFKLRGLLPVPRHDSLHSLIFQAFMAPPDGEILKWLISTWETQYHG